MGDSAESEHWDDASHSEIARLWRELEERFRPSQEAFRLRDGVALMARDPVLLHVWLAANLDEDQDLARAYRDDAELRKDIQGFLDVVLSDASPGQRELLAFSLTARGAALCRQASLAWSERRSLMARVVARETNSSRLAASSEVAALQRCRKSGKMEPGRATDVRSWSHRPAKETRTHGMPTEFANNVYQVYLAIDPLDLSWVPLETGREQLHLSLLQEGTEV